MTQIIFPAGRIHFKAKYIYLGVLSTKMILSKGDSIKLHNLILCLFQILFSEISHGKTKKRNNICNIFNKALEPVYNVL